MEFEGPAKRCVCSYPQPYAFNEHVVACQKCDGWYSIEISHPDDLEALRRRFPPAAAD
jgi:hypothetical protein